MMRVSLLQATCYTLRRGHRCSCCCGKGQSTVSRHWAAKTLSKAKTKQPLLPVWEAGDDATRLSREVSKSLRPRVPWTDVAVRASESCQDALHAAQLRHSPTACMTTPQSSSSLRSPRSPAPGASKGGMKCAVRSGGALYTAAKLSTMAACDLVAPS